MQFLAEADLTDLLNFDHRRHVETIFSRVFRD